MSEADISTADVECGTVSEELSRNAALCNVSELRCAREPKLVTA